ncbi:hypothetical protein ICV35_10635 [Rhodococcus ruber]|uniref:hypothetical protein n=1 Tax=Rhodococcus ruber TaxID=1830 RepID=UPI0017840FB3|nr:hypothetical protein [Rhodococcus ruber]MBD8054129.1 hypothetical protein [Rhodococcus ruber]WKK13025.1 hypothetical protein QYN14_05360 [Rhodococcus ruber]
MTAAPSPPSPPMPLLTDPRHFDVAQRLAARTVLGVLNGDRSELKAVVTTAAQLDVLPDLLALLGWSTVNLDVLVSIGRHVAAGATGPEAWQLTRTQFARQQQDRIAQLDQRVGADKIAGDR